MSISVRFVAVALAVGATSAQAAVFTVGAGGTHSSITAAVAAAHLSPGSDEVRIAAGVRVENVMLGAPAAETTVISGGWNAAFAVRSADPGLTVIDGGAAGHGIYGALAQGRVELSNLTVRNGQSFTGGGIEVDVSGTAQLLLADLVLHDNLATWEFASNGGGLKIVARNDGAAEIRDSVIRDNRAISTANSTLGGGAYFNASDNGQILVQRCTFESNQAQSPTEPRGGGIYIDTFGASSIEIRRSDLRGNRLLGGADSGGSGAAINSINVGTSALTLRALAISDNRDESRPDGGQQMSVQTANGATLTLGDSEISAGTGGGAQLLAFDTSRIDLTNLTIADNPAGGLVLNRSAGAGTSLFNSILYGNGGVELSSNIAANLGANLIEGAPGAANPRFVNPAARDYRLLIGSPAIDAGDDAPPAGIGSTDADGGLRIVAGQIDVGAFEYGSFRVFANGFEN